MSELECQNIYCVKYGKGEWFCNCKKAEKKGSAAVVALCPANRKMQNDLKNKSKESIDIN